MNTKHTIMITVALLSGCAAPNWNNGRGLDPVALGMLMNNMQQTQRNAVDIGIASGYQQAIIGSRPNLFISPLPTPYNGFVPQFHRF